MAIAGKVAVTPKGEWSAATAYTKLDFVTHNNRAYIARKASTGAEPAGVSDEYWMLSMDNSAIAEGLDAKLSYADNTILGSHNLLHIPSTVTSQTINGVTFTVNRNDAGEVESIVVGGNQTATAAISFSRIEDLSFLKRGVSYTMTGCPKGGSLSTYLFQINKKSPSIHDFGNGVTFEFEEGVAYNYFQLYIAPGYTTPAEGLTFRPMLRLATDTDTTFTPYAATNTELTEGLHELSESNNGKMSYVDNRVLGAHNMLHIPESVVSQTINGVKIDVNRNAGNEVTEIIANGTPTESFNLIITETKNHNLGGMIFSCAEGGSYSSYYAMIYDASSGNTVGQLDASVTVPNSFTNYRFVIHFEAGFLFENVKFYPMVRLPGDTDITFAPYAMTNQELTAEVANIQTQIDDAITTTTELTINGSSKGGLKVVEIGGRCEQNSTTGKNFFDISKFSPYLDSIAISESKITNAKTDTKTSLQMVVRQNNSNGRVIGVITDIASTGRFSMQLSVSSDTEIIYLGHNGSAQDLTISGNCSLSAGTYTISFNVEKNNPSVVGGLVISDIQIELGSTATDYEPYTGGIPSPNPDYPQEIKSVVVDKVKTVGKNLYQKSLWYKNNTGSFDDKGDSNANRIRMSPAIPISKGGTYVVSGIPNGITPGFVFVFDKNKNAMPSVDFNGDKVTLPDNTRYYAIVCTGSNFTSDTNILLNNANIQLEEGSTATPYTPYQSTTISLTNPITLNGIGDVQDEIVEKDGVFGKYKRFGTVVFDGSDDEGWALAVTNSDYKTYSYTLPSFDGKALWNDIRSYGNQGIQSGYGAYYGNGNYYAIASDTRVAYLCVPSTISDVTALKTHLSSHPYIITYELATPVFEPLPAADQIALRSLKTFDEVTYVEFLGSEVEPSVEFEYGTSKVGGYAVEAVNQSLIPYNVYAQPPVYGFHIDGNESDPSEKVEYIADAHYMKPAYMDYANDVFDYGSWGDVWFVKDCKPCILNQDGTVQAYLDKDDMTKDVYGNTVTIDSTLTGANVMIEFPKIWYKVVPDADDASSASIYISPVKVDAGYKDYAYIDKDGNHQEHFYMPAYNGSLVDNVMRSLSGQALAKSTTAQQEINYCKANGDGWYTEDAGEVMLINFLLILMGKSTDTQTVFGRGIDSGGESTFNAYRTGAGNTKGLFWGSNDGSQLVKVFGIENWWGLQWRRYAGDINNKGTRKIKLCYGNEDGSTVSGFNLDGTGYVDVGATPSGASGGYISKMKFTGSGMYSEVSSGSATTDYTDGQWMNNAQINYALRGGHAVFGLLCGTLCVDLNNTAGDAGWVRCGAPSYK